MNYPITKDVSVFLSRTNKHKGSKMQKNKKEEAKIGSPSWSDVDWSMRDVDIAEARGVSRERVRQMRMALGKPPSPKKWQRSAAGEIRVSEMDCSAMTPEEVAKKADVSESYARFILQKLNKPHVRPPDGRIERRKYQWDTVTMDQWNSMTDKEISQLLKISNPVLVTQWRLRHGIVRRCQRKHS